MQFSTNKTASCRSCVFKGMCKKCLAGNDSAWEKRGESKATTKGLTIIGKTVKITSQ